MRFIPHFIGRRIVKVVFIALFSIVPLLFVVPNVFMAMTYFLIPGDTLDTLYPADGFLVNVVDKDDEVCVITNLGGLITVHPHLSAKFLVDEQIVPFWDIDSHKTYYFDDPFEHDLVCIKPNLAPGEHTVQFVKRNWVDVSSVTHTVQVMEDGSIQH